MFLDPYIFARDKFNGARFAPEEINNPVNLFASKSEPPELPRRSIKTASTL